MIHLADWLPYIAIANFGLTWGLGFYLWLVRRGIATDQRVSKVESHLMDKYEEHAKRITHMEGVMERAPSHQDLAVFHERLNDLAKTLHLLVGENATQSQLLRTLVTHHVK